MKLERSFKLRTIARRTRLFALAPLAIVLIAPLAAHAQGTPLDTGFTNLQNLFTGTVAKVGSLIAIVVGGYQFAHGEPGAKRALWSQLPPCPESSPPVFLQEAERLLRREIDFPEFPLSLRR